MNKLYYGDNLSIMERMAKYSVDMIYLDPPFKSQQNYNLIYKTMTGKPVPEQAEAFCDTWEMDAEKERLALAVPSLLHQHGVEDYYVEFWRLWIQALRQTQPHLLAYLIYMVQRLLHMKSILKPTGSIYLHCDPTASHYIKVMMDGIFGHINFRNEIVWKRTSGHSDARRQFGEQSDRILFYSMSRGSTFNPQYGAYSDAYIKSHYSNSDPDGRRYTTRDLRSPNPRPNLTYEYKGYKPHPNGWSISRGLMEKYDAQGLLQFPKSQDGRLRLKRYLDEMPGAVLGNIWDDIPPINSQARERMGYPTQKPIALLRRIIAASTKPGDVVFDPFCGCGTSIYAAHETGRRWIGCDVAILAVRLIEDQLSIRYGLVEGDHFQVDGIPNSVDAAKTLWNRDRFQFEHWVVEKIGGFPTKKTGDRGVDGRLYFETKNGLKSMVISVKGGGIHPTDIRDLRGVLEREPDAEMAGFLSLREPTKGMREEAASAGQYEYSGNLYNRMQLLTVRDILEERREFHTPTKVGSRIVTGQTLLPL